jgi:NADPH-dependent curcumin reductase
VIAVPSNKCVIVKAHAIGIPGPENFEILERPIPRLLPGGVLVRILYASVDPGMRGWVSVEPNYMTIPVGTVMRAPGISEIVKSDHPDFGVGDLVYGMFGWAEWFAAEAKDIYWKIDTGIAPPPVWLGSLGINGITAWIGYRHFGRPKAGETLLVTTAAGSVGSVVGQLAKKDGIRAIGIAGGAEKAAIAAADFGYEQVIDYRNSADLVAELNNICAKGIDIFYDNVAGQQADSAFPLMNPKGRVIQCGSASVSSWLPWPTGPRRERDMIVKRLSWHGFVVMDHADLFADALVELSELYADTKLFTRQDSLDGLEKAPGAIQYLYSGMNTGKLSIKIAE